MIIKIVKSTFCFINACILLLCMVFLTCKKVTVTEVKSDSVIKYIEGRTNDVVNCIEKTADGGFIYCGNTGVDSSRLDGFLMKVDANGKKEWYKTYGGINQDELRKVIQTSDGGYLAVGTTNSIGVGATDVNHNMYDYEVKVTKDGNIEWSASKYTEPAKLYGVVETPDHNYYVTGYGLVTNWNPWVVTLMKLTADGNRTYIRYFKDFASYPPYNRNNLYHAYGLDVSVAADGSAIINGQMSHSNLYVEISKHMPFTITTKTNGTLNSLEPYFPYYRAEEYYSARGLHYMKTITLPDGYLIASYGEGLTDHIMRIELIKTDLSGKLIWEKKYPGLGNSILHNIQLLPNGNIMIMGASSEKKYNVAFPEGFFNLKTMLLQIDKDGTVLWEKFSGGEKNSNIYKCIQTQADGSFLLAGYTALTESGFHKMNWMKADDKGELIK